MTRQRDGDDVRELLGRAATSWSGPTPRASGSRWAAVEHRRQRRSRALRLAGAGAVLGAVLLAAGTVAAAAISPNGAVGSAERLMAHVFAGPAPTTPPIGTLATPSPTEGSAPASPGSPSARPTPRLSPRPSPSDDLHRTSPGVSPHPSPTDE